MIALLLISSCVYSGSPEDPTIEQMQAQRLQIEAFEAKYLPEPNQWTDEDYRRQALRSLLKGTSPQDRRTAPVLQGSVRRDLDVEQARMHLEAKGQPFPFSPGEYADAVAEAERTFFAGDCEKMQAMMRGSPLEQFAWYQAWVELGSPEGGEVRCR